MLLINITIILNIFIFMKFFLLVLREINNYKVQSLYIYLVHAFDKYESTL